MLTWDIEKRLYQKVVFDHWEQKDLVIFMKSLFMIGKDVILNT